MSEQKPIAMRLAAEVQRQLDIQERLGAALMKDLESVETSGRKVLDFNGEVVDTVYVPDRDWARCYGHYRGSNKDLLAEERERTKLKLLVQGKDKAVLTDEEYQAEMATLALESVKALPNDALEAEMRARGLVVVVPALEDE